MLGLALALPRVGICSCAGISSELLPLSSHCLSPGHRDRRTGDRMGTGSPKEPASTTARIQPCWLEPGLRARGLLGLSCSQGGSILVVFLAVPAQGPHAYPRTPHDVPVQHSLWSELERMLMALGEFLQGVFSEGFCTKCGFYNLKQLVSTQKDGLVTTQDVLPHLASAFF